MTNGTNHRFEQTKPDDERIPGLVLTTAPKQTAGTASQARAAVLSGKAWWTSTPVGGSAGVWRCGWREAPAREAVATTALREPWRFCICRP